MTAEAPNPPHTETLSFLMTDIVGSSPMWAADEAAMRVRVERYDRVVERVVEACAGEIIRARGEGDSHFAVFRSPANAVAAAVRLNVELRKSPELTGISIRAAVNTGELQARDGTYYGNPINRGARIREIGNSGQVLVSQATYHLIHKGVSEFEFISLGPHRLRDLEGPERLYQAHPPGELVHFPPLRSLSQMQHNLPIQLTSFVGREFELAELESHLHRRRLVTATGAGGSGKTRLALQVAAKVLETFPGGAWFVDLSAVSDPRDVAGAIAAALSLKPDAGMSVKPEMDGDEGALLNHLRDQQALLILDNCEHLLPRVTSLVHRLLHHCPYLRIMATSRETLGLDGEQVYRVPALQMATNEDPAEQVRVSDAVRLFQERTQANGFEISLEGANLQRLNQLCHRVDGLPLAIVHLAGAAAVRSLQEMFDQITDIIKRDHGPSHRPSRQATVLATVEYSLGLLAPEVSELLGRLTIFANGWTRDAAEQVCGFAPMPKESIVEALRLLVQRSSVERESDEGGEIRFRLLETTRDVLQSGKRDSKRLRDRYIAYFQTLTSEAHLAFNTEREPDAFRTLHVEYENIGKAISIAKEIADLRWVELTLAMRRYWPKSGRLGDGLRALQAVTDSPDVDSVSRGRAFNAIGSYLISLSQDDDARTALLHAKACLEEVGGIDYAIVLANLGILASHAYRFDEAIDVLRQADRACANLGDVAIHTTVLTNLGIAQLRSNSFDDSTVGILRLAADQARRSGSLSVEAEARNNAGHTLMLLNRLQEAMAEMRAAFVIWREVVDLRETTGGLFSLAALFQRLEHPAGAALAQAAAETLKAQHGFEFDRELAKLHEQTRLWCQDPSHANDWKSAGRFVKGKTLEELVGAALTAISLFERQSTAGA